MYWPGGFFDYYEGHSSAGSDGDGATGWWRGGENGGATQRADLRADCQHRAPSRRACGTVIARAGRYADVPPSPEFSLPANSRTTVPITIGGREVRRRRGSTRVRGEPGRRESSVYRTPGGPRPGPRARTRWPRRCREVTMAMMVERPVWCCGGVGPGGARWRPRGRPSVSVSTAGRRPTDRLQPRSRRRPLRRLRFVRHQPRRRRHQRRSGRLPARPRHRRRRHLRRARRRGDDPPQRRRRAAAGETARAHAGDHAGRPLRRVRVAGHQPPAPRVPPVPASSCIASIGRPAPSPWSASARRARPRRFGLSPQSAMTATSSSFVSRRHQPVRASRPDPPTACPSIVRAAAVGTRIGRLPGRVGGRACRSRDLASSSE